MTTMTPRERAAARWIQGGPGGEDVTPPATRAGASSVSPRRPSKVLAPTALTRAPEVGRTGPTRAPSARSSSSAAAPSRTTGHTAAAEPRALCAWCDEAELELAPGSHGICFSCRVRSLLFGSLETLAVVAGVVGFGLAYALAGVLVRA